MPATPGSLCRRREIPTAAPGPTLRTVVPARKRTPGSLEQGRRRSPNDSANVDQTAAASGRFCGDDAGSCAPPLVRWPRRVSAVARAVPADGVPTESFGGLFFAMGHLFSERGAHVAECSVMPPTISPKREFWTSKKSANARLPAVSPDSTLSLLESYLGAEGSVFITPDAFFYPVDLFVKAHNSYPSLPNKLKSSQHG